ncbi:MAG: ArnT family glycosyltransferase [Pyrinomonadaceae bacterium]
MTKKHSAFRISRPAFTRLLFALVIIAVYFFGLSIPLLGPDEPRYAEVGREMFLRGDWITPTLGGFDWFEKPALLYWLEILSYKIFGVSEFAARFGFAVFGLGTIFSLWILGKTVESPESRVQSPKLEKQISAFSVQHSSFANWLALIAASSIGLIAFARAASFDIILTFPMTASLVGFFIYDLTDRRTGAQTQDNNSKIFSILARHLPLVAFYFFIGAALIAKGLIGIVFPFTIVAFSYILSRKMPSKHFILSLVWGATLSLLVAAVWYAPMYRANGWKCIDEFFIRQQFERYISNKYQHSQPFWFFFLVLPLMTIPWLPFFLASIWNFAKFQISNFKFQVSKSKISFHSPLTIHHSPLMKRLSIFAFAWMIVPLVFFSLSGSKLPG